MTGTGSGRRAMCVIAIVTTALVSASLATPGDPIPGTIVFASDLSPAAAAPGRRIGETRIHAFPLDGPARFDVTGAAYRGTNDRAVSRSPDGRKIAFMRTRRGTDLAELWIADSNGANATRLLTPAPAESFTYSDSEPYFGGPKWSPQGDRLAIDVVSTASCGPSSTKCASWYTALVHLDGTRIDGGGVNAVWSPDGRALLVRTGLFSLEDPPYWGLGLTQADGSNGWDAEQTWKRPGACWSGGSWSPNGARVVLVESVCDGSVRRLHIVDARSGSRLAVVRGCCASWAPDGGRLWYVAFGAGAGELTVATRDGRRVRRVGRTTDLVAWSPRGGRVAAVRRAGARDELIFVRADGTRARAVAQAPARALEVVGWSHDDRWFAFLRRDGDRAMLVVARGDGTRPRVVYRRTGRVLTGGSWSPDSRYLAFWDTLAGTTSRLVLLDVLTGRSRTIYRALEGAYAILVGWSADRSLLVNETISGLYPDELWTVKPNGSGLRRLTRNERGELDPAWSPDGSRLAFWRDDPRKAKRPEDLSVYVMSSEGGEPRKVVGGARGSWASDPDWSPDGRSLVFVRRPKENSTDVWVVGLDGKRLRRVTTSGHAYAPAWSPDGRAIVYSNNGTPTLVASDGTGARSIVDKAVAQYCDGFAWSPDGLNLAMGCQVPDGLFVVRADGRDLRSVERTAAKSASWSPDGKWLVYESDQTLRIVAATGGNTSTIDLRGAAASAPDWSPR